MTPDEESFLLRALKLDTRRCCQSCAVITHFIYHICRAVPSGRVQSALRAQEGQRTRAAKRTEFTVSEEERRALREREELAASLVEVEKITAADAQDAGVESAASEHTSGVEHDASSSEDTHDPTDDEVTSPPAPRRSARTTLNF